MEDGNTTYSYTKLANKQKENDINNQKKLDVKIDLSEKAKKKLILVCLVCSCFMLIEFIGGLISNSLAIMTDAAHLLSDLAGFVISIVSIYISKFPSNKNYSYGYHRAEIVGALLSVFIIWILTLLLLIESFIRIFDPHHDIHGGYMLLISTIGLVFNIIMVYILHSVRFILLII